ncbi:MAG TPA: polysaccharide deacetylase family protein [Thermoanaerobaculia bacterium]|nr:polysaccharide deacetylase family protein [Thermoanaerobaculia bacterium]
MNRPRFSIVVPTRDRRALVIANVRALAALPAAPEFEAIVVVDGDRDGTAPALRSLAVPFPLRVLEQPNRGAAAARNAGAAAAKGEILLFLDDDMEPDAGLLVEHDRRHREGAGVVLGHMPMHPDSPRNLLSRRVEVWAESRRRFLSRASRIPGRELRTGQLSIRRELFAGCGGFDTSFTRGGTFGGEDVELGMRLERAGVAIVFEPRAVSRQHYVVPHRSFLDRRRDLGAAHVMLERKHPGPPPPQLERARDRWIGRWLWPLLRPVVLALLERGVRARWLDRVFDGLAGATYASGVRAAGGFPAARTVRVLAYHSVSDLRGARRIAKWGVPRDQLRRQLRWLARLGARFVTPDELLRMLRGEGAVPRRAILLTFDDAYEDQLSAALPVLEEVGAMAVVFAPSGQVGRWNVWDERLGAPRLPLCDAEQLRELLRRGVEIGSHGRSHALLPNLDEDELRRELERSIAELGALGLPPPRLLSYPYGLAGARELAAAARAGFAAAFTIAPGLVTPVSDPHALPRIEILRGDRGLRFLVKIFLAGRLSRRSARRPQEPAP